MVLAGGLTSADGMAFALFPDSATLAVPSPVTLTSAIPPPAARAGTMTAAYSASSLTLR
jgi:hypothetical protein